MTTRVIRPLAFSAIAALGLAACAAETDLEDFADESDLLDAAGKADAPGLYDFVTARVDASGTYVARVNRNQTRCADGSLADECKVASISIDLPPQQRAELDAALSGGHVVLRGLQADGGFAATEAWLGLGPDAPVGPFTHIEDSGVRCFTWPCDSLREAKLNSTLTAGIAGLDWDASGADQDAIDKGYSATVEPDGLIVAGYRGTITGPAGRGKTREITQFYTRLLPSTGGACVVSGCSGQVCGDEVINTTCEWRESYACYADAVCERQAGGECGWTETPALEACLAGAI